jgi:hypothetical protein
MTEYIAATENRVDDCATISILSKVPSSATNVYEINPLSDPRWKVFVTGHPKASAFHTASWLRALHTAYGYEPVVITTSSPDTALTNGLAFCRIKSWLTGRRLVSLPFSDHAEPLADNSEQIDNLLFEMKRRVDVGQWKYVEIRPTSFLPG